MNGYHESGDIRKRRSLPRILAIVSAMVLYGFSVRATELSPEFGNPSGIAIFEAGTWIIFFCMFVYFVLQSVRAGTLSFGLLVFISSVSMFWQEFYADWGAYLLYNPKFALIPWGSTLWTTPNKPWFMPASYGWFNTIVFLAMLWMVRRLRARFLGLGRTAAVLIVGVPIFYIWDLLLEGYAAIVGWWTYVEYFGPAIVSKKGNWPFLHPILIYTVYGVVALWFLDLRGADGRVKFESWFGIERTRDTMWRESARIGVWVLVMNVLYLLFLIIPLIAVRELFGVPSAIVP